MKLKINYPDSLIPNNLDTLVENLNSLDNRVVAQKAIQERDKKEFSEGIINAVKKAIQERNRMQQSSNSSSREMRENRILRECSSDGKTTARK